MKNRKDVIDLIRNTDEETFNKIVKDYPQSDKKKADKLFRQIERRLEDGSVSPDRTDTIEVSGVERYRPQRFRRAVSIAACAAVVAAGAGTVYAVKSNAPSGDKPLAALSTSETLSDDAVTSVDYSNIDQDYIIDLCSNARSNYSALSISYTNTNSGDTEHIYTGSLQIDNTADTLWSQEDVNILRKGSTIGQYNGFMFINGSNRVYRIAESEEKYKVENDYSGSGSMYYCPSVWVELWLSSKSEWTIGEKVTFAGRDCVMIHGTAPKKDISPVSGMSFTMWIDIETGVPLRYTLKGQSTNVFEVNSITYNDTSGFMTKKGVKEYLKDYQPAEENYDLSFLDDTSQDHAGIPGEITQQWLYQRCKNAEHYFTRCYMETNENGLLVTKAADNQKGIMYYTTDGSGRIDYAYGKKRISIFEQSKDVVENPVENMKSIRYDGSLDDMIKWSIEGREEYLGRDCAVIRVASDPVNSQHDSAFETQRFIDLETGITLRIGVYQGNTIQFTLETTKFLVDDEASMIPEPLEISKLISENGYSVEDGLDLSFLNDEPTAAETTEAIKQEYPTNESGLTYGPDAPWAITIDDEPDLQAVIGDHGTKGYCYKNDSLRPDDGPGSPEEAIARQEEAKKYGQPGIVLFVYESDGKTIVDTFTMGSRDTKMPLDISLVFASLDSLDYEPISCDGLPTHKLTSPLGTIYYIHLGDTAADSYVWRRPSLVSVGDNEAPLTDYAFAALHENWDKLDIVELNYKN